ncbi:uncharacterized protein GLRG_09328 [Colletotrichum graminicola M1.001]|uniref:Uncharacterized protein n=1 Tax=Colletotrichum graminicola (strain M1.001 / M2 / FGSC 10212) TaxID=645133 RepID=E3QTJ6_COLGM|nr:uncharacterized protein GLRG_09328 [Colletotrichum graminicola M1.001]EFQ34184.1 hypothetical protein GLRG_09328 [Colletotrichum graminicola M1.001]
MLPSSVLGSLTQKDAACRGACCAGIRGRILEHRGKWTSDQPSRDARAGAGSRRITTHRPCFPGQTQTHVLREREGSFQDKPKPRADGDEEMLKTLIRLLRSDKDINHAYSRVFKQIGIEMQDTMKYQGISDGLAIVFWSGFISVTWLYTFSFSAACSPLFWIVIAEALDTEARSNELSITTMVSFAFDTRTFRGNEIRGTPFYLLFVVCNVTNAIIFDDDSSPLCP